MEPNHVIGADWVSQGHNLGCDVEDRGEKLYLVIMWVCGFIYWKNF